MNLYFNHIIYIIMLNIIFFDMSEDIVNEYQKKLSYLTNKNIKLQFINSSFQNLINDYHIDITVSPANSWGSFNGGIDREFKKLYHNLEIKTRDIIDNKKYALCERGYYLPVGKAIFVEINHKKLKYLLVAPTMFLPKDIRGTMNVYLAFTAILEKIYKLNDVTVACSGLGTGIGAISAKESAEQIHQAFNDFFMNNSA